MSIRGKLTNKQLSAEGIKRTDNDADIRQKKKLKNTNKK